MVKARELLWAAQEGKENLEWGTAELYADLAADHTPEWIAREYGVPAARVRRYILTHRAFPEPAKDIPFEVHMVCATKTTHPEKWLQEAIEHAWTATELRAAIRAAGVERTECDWMAQGEAIVQRLRKFYEDAPGPVADRIKQKVRYLGD